MVFFHSRFYPKISRVEKKYGEKNLGTILPTKIIIKAII